MRITLHKLIFVTVLALGNACNASIAWSAAIPQHSPGSIAVNPSGIIYYAQAGDTLMSIAQRLTTKTGNWAVLGKINRIDKDSNIPIGTAVVIPAELLADEPSAATVIARNGAITATFADGSTASLDIGSKIVEGMKIDTGVNSFLTISLVDASRVSLPSNSSVLLATLRKTLYTGSPRTEVKLLHGRVVSRVTSLTVNKGRFDIRTPSSVAGVRGTHFRVGLDGTKVETEVLSGHVAVGSPPAPETLVLNIAQGDVITPHSIGPAIDLLPPPQLASAPYREDGAAQFSLTPIAGARAYHVQLAQDAEGLNLLAEARSNTSQVAIDNIQEGSYFVVLSAIDKSGLEGMPSTLAVTIKNRVDPLKDQSGQPAPSVESSDGKQLILRWTGSASRKYNIQVARDLEFSWLQFTSSVTGNKVTLPRPSFGTYFARVQSINADGSTNPFSFAQTFIVTDQWIINDGQPLRSKEPARSKSR